MSQYEFKESDWKLFRKKYEEWIESFLERCCSEYAAILGSDMPAVDRFNEVAERIENDSRKTEFAIRNSREQMTANIFHLVENDVIEIDDLEGFSEELQEYLRGICDFLCQR